GADLPGQDPLGLIGIALRLVFADAQDRLEAGPQSSGDLARQGLVALAEVLAPLGVAEDDAVDAELEQHRRRHLAGERALRLLVHVLGGDPHATLRAVLDGALQSGERRA